jgi:hypothetical protein
MSYIGNPPISGNFQVCDAISVVNGQAAYTMQVSSANVSPETANHMLVSLNGVLQKPGSSFTISGSTITFASNLATGDVIDFILLLGNVNDIGTPSDATVTDAKTNFVSTSSAAGLQIKGDGTTDGTLQLNCSQNSHGVKLKSPAHSASQSYTLTLPATAPATDKMLQTNSSGVLSFVDAPSGSHTLLSETNITSGVSSVALSSVFTTTYRDYLIVCSALHVATNNSHVQITFYDSSGEKTSSYRFAALGVADDAANPDANSDNESQGRVFNTRGVGAGSEDIVNIKGTLFHPRNSTHYKYFDYTASSHNENDSNRNQYETGSIIYEATDEIVGIKFAMSSGNIDSGNIKIYGIT